MSYCVNCGVELDDSAKTCALCGTPVLNPNKPAAGETPYPEKIVIPQNKLQRYRATVATLVMLLPILVCIPINYFITPGLYWSVYVASTLILLWIFFVAPFLLRRTLPHTPYISLTLDGVITAAYIYVMYHYNSTGTWFYRIALPMVAAFVVLGYILIFFCQKNKNASLIRKVAFTLAMVALYAAATEFIFLISMPNLIADCVALTVFFTTAVLAIFLRFASENKQFRAWVSRKFFL